MRNALLSLSLFRLNLSLCPSIYIHSVEGTSELEDHQIVSLLSSLILHYIHQPHILQSVLQAYLAIGLYGYQLADLGRASCSYPLSLSSSFSMSKYDDGKEGGEEGPHIIEELEPHQLVCKVLRRYKDKKEEYVIISTCCAIMRMLGRYNHTYVSSPID